MRRAGLSGVDDPLEEVLVGHSPPTHPPPSVLTVHRMGVWKTQYPTGSIFFRQVFSAYIYKCSSYIADIQSILGSMGKAPPSCSKSWSCLLPCPPSCALDLPWGKFGLKDLLHCVKLLLHVNKLRRCVSRVHFKKSNLEKSKSESCSIGKGLNTHVSS